MKLLEVRHLDKSFPVREGLLQRVVAKVKAVDDVSFTIDAGETLGLVGESGCGKTTTGRAILRLVEPDGGDIVYKRVSHDVDVRAATSDELKNLRREMTKRLQVALFRSLYRHSPLFEAKRIFLVARPYCGFGMALNSPMNCSQPCTASRFRKIRIEALR